MKQEEEEEVKRLLCHWSGKAQENVSSEGKERRRRWKKEERLSSEIVGQSSRILYVGGEGKERR